jgi:hypothetical protein
MAHRTSNRRLSAPVVAVGAFLATGGAAMGADLPVKAPPPPVVPVSAWTFQFTPYGWLPSLNGDVTVRGRTAHVDATFLDIAEHAKIPKDLIGLMGYFEARNGPWALFGDLVYVKAAISASGSRTTSVAPEVSGTLAASLGVTVKMAIAEAGAAYEVMRWGTAPGSGTALDVYAGARLWWQSVDLNLAVTAGVTVADLVNVSGGRAIAESGDVSWVDGLIGLRLRHQFAPGHQVFLAGDIGGGGSNFSWQLVGAYSFDIARTQHITWAGVIGYRALFVDFEKGSGLTRYEYDMLQHGPLFGVTARF